MTVETKVNPNRGKIYDRNGNILVSNKTVWILYAIPKNIKNPKLISENLSKILGFNEEIIYSKISQKNYKYQIINNAINEEKTNELRRYIDENNLNYQFNMFNENYINSTYNFYIKNKDYDNNTIEIICNFYSNKFPKSKKLEINFENISFLNENSSDYILNKSTNLEIEVEDKFYNRNEIEYVVTKCSNPTLNITKAILYNTGFRFEFDAKFEPWYENDASEEEIKKAYEKFSEWKKNEKILNGKNVTLIEDAYIENEIGEKFFPLKSSTEDTFIQYQTSGEFDYMQTFDLTQFDINSQKIKIYFNINLPYIKENVVVELECK